VVETPPELGVARVNWRAGDPATLAAFRAALAADQSDQAFRATLASLSPDVGVSLWGEDLQVNAATWGRIPRTYVRFTQDRTIPVELQDRMIAEADRLAPDTAFTVHSVPASHVGPLDRPEITKIVHDLTDTAAR
jgi:hypothetical protein